MTKERKERVGIKRLDLYNLSLINDLELTSKNNMPITRATHSVPKSLVPFNVALSSIVDKNSFVHFFIDDYLFDRVWRNPKRYLSVLSQYKGIIAPDFSLYRDMPIAMQIWNTYRNRVLSAYYSKCGIDVIPCVGWSDERSYGFCFEGLPKYSVVAVSTNGCLVGKENAFYFTMGFNQMIKILKPTTILSYGRPLTSLYNNCKTRIILYDSYSQSLKQKLQRNGRKVL